MKKNRPGWSSFFEKTVIFFLILGNCVIFRDVEWCNFTNFDAFALKWTFVKITTVYTTSFVVKVTFKFWYYMPAFRTNIKYSGNNMYISIPSINHVVVAGSGKEKGGIHSKNEIEKWLNEGFKGNTLIFILFLYDGIQCNLGKTLRYSRVLGVWKLENQWWYSLKLGDFGDVKGLRPLTSPKPPVSMKPPLVSSFQPPEHVKPQIFAQVSRKPS